MRQMIKLLDAKWKRSKMHGTGYMVEKGTKVRGANSKLSVKSLAIINFNRFWQKGIISAFVPESSKANTWAGAIVSHQASSGSDPGGRRRFCVFLRHHHQAGNAVRITNPTAHLGCIRIFSSKIIIVTKIGSAERTICLCLFFFNFCASYFK